MQHLEQVLTPAAYRSAAEAAARSAAVSEDEREAAGKALEVAGIYEIYEDVLAKADAVDFGDLVLLATQALEQNPEALPSEARDAKSSN